MVGNVGCAQVLGQQKGKNAHSLRDLYSQVPTLGLSPLCSVAVSRRSHFTLFMTESWTTLISKIQLVVILNAAFWLAELYTARLLVILTGSGERRLRKQKRWRLNPVVLTFLNLVQLFLTDCLHFTLTYRLKAHSGTQNNTVEWIAMKNEACDE